MPGLMHYARCSRAHDTIQGLLDTVLALIPGGADREQIIRQDDQSCEVLAALQAQGSCTGEHFVAARRSLGLLLMFRDGG